MTKLCAWCKKPFIVSKDKKKFCSNRCVGLAHRKRIILSCPVCSKQFSTLPQFPYRKKFCSYKCFCKNQIGLKRPEDWMKITHPNGYKGNKHPAWKGGKFFDGHYIRIWNGEHLPNGKPKYIGEHRYVMSQFLKRPLKRNEIVHHIDKDTRNNNISNLIILSPSQHSKLHSENGFKIGNKFGTRKNK
jgi:hypothetical protein